MEEASARSPSSTRRAAVTLGTASPADWRNLFNAFPARWGHRRRRRHAALTAEVTMGLRHGSAHVAACRRQFGCRRWHPSRREKEREREREREREIVGAIYRYKSLEIIVADGRLIAGHIIGRANARNPFGRYGQYARSVRTGESTDYYGKDMRSHRLDDR